MPVATYEGIVEGGTVKLPAGILLPERTAVYVVVPKLSTEDTEVFDVVLPQGPIHMRSPRLKYREQAADFVLEVRETPSADL